MALMLEEQHDCELVQNLGDDMKSFGYMISGEERTSADNGSIVVVVLRLGCSAYLPASLRSSFFRKFHECE